MHTAWEKNGNQLGIRKILPSDHQLELARHCQGKGLECRHGSIFASRSRKRILLVRHTRTRFDRLLCCTEIRMNLCTAPVCTTQNIAQFLANNFGCSPDYNRTRRGTICRNIFQRPPADQADTVLDFQPYGTLAQF